MSLTPKQQRFLQFIESFSQTKGYAPSQAEIAKKFGFRSLGTVQNYLKALESAGHLSRQKHLSRSVQLTSFSPESISIPLLGRVAAGKPIEAIEQNENVEVPKNLIKGGSNFALHVRGDSMIEEGIHDGDMVIVRKQRTAENGKIIIGMLEGEATVKKFYKKKDSIELRPANPVMKPIVVKPDQTFQILGVVVGLIRKYDT
jgi:repressor LexA